MGKKHGDMFQESVNAVQKLVLVLKNPGATANMAATAEMVKSAAVRSSQDANKLAMMGDQTVESTQVLLQEILKNLTDLVMVGISVVCIPFSGKCMNHVCRERTHKVLKAYSTLFTAMKMSQGASKETNKSVGEVWAACKAFETTPLTNHAATKLHMLACAKVVADAKRESDDITELEEGQEPEEDDMGAVDTVSPEEMRLLQPCQTLLSIGHDVLKRGGVCIGLLDLPVDADTMEWTDAIAAAASEVEVQSDELVCSFMEAEVDRTALLSVAKDYKTALVKMLSRFVAPRPAGGDEDGGLEDSNADQGRMAGVKGFLKWHAKSTGELDAAWAELMTGLKNATAGADDQS